MTAMGSDSVKWVVNVVLSRRSEGRVAHAQSLFASRDDGDGTVVCQWQSDSVIAIVRACERASERASVPRLCASIAAELSSYTARLLRAGSRDRADGAAAAGRGVRRGCEKIRQGHSMQHRGERKEEGKGAGSVTRASGRWQ